MSVSRADLTERTSSQERFSFSVSGTFSDIWRGILQEGENKIPIAIKAMRGHFPSEISGYDRYFEAFQELRSHENILPIFGYHSSFEIDEAFAFISPWQDGGNAVDFVKEKDIDDRLKVVHGAAQGLAALHSSGLVHGSFRGANILISKEGVPRVTDYGLHIIMPRNVTDSQSEIYDCAPFIPLELLTGKEREPTMKGDIWAFATTLVELIMRLASPDLTGKLKCYTGSGKWKQPEFPDDFAPIYLKASCGELCCKCWSTTAKARPSMHNITQNISGMCGTSASSTE